MSAINEEASTSYTIKEEPLSSDDYAVEENDDDVTTELYDDTPNDPATLPFEPEANGLPSNFRLTKFSDIKSRGVRPNLNDEYFMAISEVDQVAENEVENQESTLIFGAKTLCTRLNGLDTYLIETSNTLTPLIENPYAMGKIACLSILSGIYALGIVDFTTIRMNLAFPTRMESNAKEIVIPMIIRGFTDTAKESGNNVKCGDITINRWCLIGGTASAICNVNEFMPPDGAVPGDVIVLTKPLGTSIALKAAQWLEHPEKRKRLSVFIDEAGVEKAKHRAIDSMLRSNKDDAVLMRKYNAHAACEVSSQGILVDAMMLAKIQKNDVTFIIHNLPTIAKMNGVSRLTGDTTKLLGGVMPEYSGGLIIVMPREQAAAYCKATMQESRYGWIIGLIEKGEKTAKLIGKPRILEVPVKESDLLLW